MGTAADIFFVAVGSGGCRGDGHQRRPLSVPVWFARGDRHFLLLLVLPLRSRCVFFFDLPSRHSSAAEEGSKNKASPPAQPKCLAYVRPCLASACLLCAWLLLALAGGSFARRPASPVRCVWSCPPVPLGWWRRPGPVPRFSTAHGAPLPPTLLTLQGS